MKNFQKHQLERSKTLTQDTLEILSRTIEPDRISMAVFRSIVTLDFRYFERRFVIVEVRIRPRAKLSVSTAEHQFSSDLDFDQTTDFLLYSSAATRVGQN